MPTAEESRRALVLVSSAAVTEVSEYVTGSAEQTRAALFEVTPTLVAYYSDGSAALAADYYDDVREQAAARGRFMAEPVVNLREEKIRNGLGWATSPLFLPEPDTELALSRLAEVVQLETARPFRDTITTNRRRDPSAIGWQRVSAGGCKFCRMLADRGAVYREATVRFASHPNCHCSAAPAFEGHPGEEASVMQYVASQRHRTPKQKQALRDYLAAMPD